jgi:hypothetical protein
MFAKLNSNEYLKGTLKYSEHLDTKTQFLYIPNVLFLKFKWIKNGKTSYPVFT